MSDDTQQVEVVDGGTEPAEEPAIIEPGKLMRIAIMLREVQEEARRAPTDEAGRGRLRAVHDHALTELCEILNEDLQDELKQFSFAFDEGTPSESEIMIAQAQLIGWLEGLFQGIKAAIFNQQHAAMQQLQAMQARGLPPGGPQDPAGERSTGHYL